MKRFDSGLSLLEVLFTVVLILIVFLGTISGIPLIFQAQTATERTETAVTIAQRLISQARFQTFSELESRKGTVVVPVLINGIVRQDQYAYELDVRSQEGELKDLTLIVSWNHSSQKKEVVLQTLVSSIAEQATTSTGGSPTARDSLDQQ